MPGKKIENIKWYSDKRAKFAHEPGIRHSFMASLATALNHIEGRLDPAWLMGGAGFAFRMFVNETMCPSAMSIFDWTEILPEVIEQAGHDCYYISRLWNEGDKEAERREQAHEFIKSGINQNIPAIVWDIADCEWGLITGYDDDRQIYDTLTWEGVAATLDYNKLGKNGIDILSVTVLGGPNGRSREEIIYNALVTAVNHASMKEWTDRPAYQNGLPAFSHWALVYDHWAMLVEAGKTENINPAMPAFAAYYAEHHYSARCYARDFISAAAGGNPHLEKAHVAYARVAALLGQVWEQAQKEEPPKAASLKSAAEIIKKAGQAEAEAVRYLRDFLSHRDSAGKAGLSLE